jgi:hypothetical protein
MWWLLLLTIVAVIGYFFYSRRDGTLTGSKEQAGKLYDLVDKEGDRVRRKKQRLVDRAATEGKTIPLSQILTPLEKSKEEHKEDVTYVAAVDRTINELRRRYKTEIPVNEAYHLETDEEESESSEGPGR